MNRAANVKDSRSLAEAWRAKLPAEYWEVLGRLRSNEERGRHDSSDLKLKLTEMEAKAGLEIPFTRVENFGTRKSLTHFQQGLRKSEVVLSFGLGDRQSLLWVVTQGSLNVYSLPPRGEIRTEIRGFRES